MESKVFAVSKQKVAARALAILVVLIIIWAYRHFNLYIGLALLPGLFIGGYFARLLFKPHGLLLDEHGLHDNVDGFGFIPWSEIAKVQLWDDIGQQTLGIHFVDPRRAIRQLPLRKRLVLALGRPFGIGEPRLRFTLLTNADEALQAIEVYLARHGGKRFV